MTERNRIEGVFTLSTPMHCATTDTSLKHPVVQNSTPTHQYRYQTSAGPENVPYFPGNDLRGRMRRMCANIVMDHLTASKKVSVELYTGLCGGSISTSPDQSALSVEEVMRAHKNVYMGLFGGGARLLKSRYCANDLVPFLQTPVDVGAVPATWRGIDTVVRRQGGDDKGPVRGFEVLEWVESFRIDDVARMSDSKSIESYVENAMDTVGKQQAAVALAQAGRKEMKAAIKAGTAEKSALTTKETLSNIFSVQVVRPGTQFYFLFDLQDDVTDGHVGLMLMGLQSLVRQQALGGWIRTGFGRFIADLVLVRDGARYPVFTSEQASASATLSDAVQSYVDAAKCQLATLTAEEMMLFFTDRPKEEKAEKPAKGKAAAVA